MSIIKKILLVVFITILGNQVNSEEVKKMGTHKDWETYIINSESGKVCFAQSKPILQSPKNNPREARLFITFRPNEKISNEISTTAGYDFNTKNSITAKSGKNKYKFNMVKTNFAWIDGSKIEKKMIRIMQKGSRIMITGNN